MIGAAANRDWLAVGDPKVQPVPFKAGRFPITCRRATLLVSPEHAMFLEACWCRRRHLGQRRLDLKVEGMEQSILPSGIRPACR